MDLNILWFILVGVLFIGFFFLEGFDYGVGMLTPFAGKTDGERRVVINSIGPFWDGNEVWLITAGGAVFAAFPHWYATLFSGFYLALFVILLALIARGVSFEFRSKVASPAWRKLWDWVICVSSFLPALLWGVAVSNFITGVPIDANMEYAGTFFTLLTPFTLLGGVVTFLLFLYHGAAFLSLKIGDEAILERVGRIGRVSGVVLVPVTVAWVVFAFLTTGLKSSPVALAAVAVAAVALVLSVVLAWTKHWGVSFIASAVTIAFVTVTVFAAMFPNVMISSLNPEWSLTIYNASSSPYTLKIMTIVALCLVPIVLIYQIMNFVIFKKRVTQDKLEY
ncbi:MAG: cytochrome d ubiquinol oxidase subunit II [Gracilibacteraceae bacterium]|nr:cytochrome d ubiquinol oxidase subunit II [Gracilibacteraceae bacterium]